MAKLRTILFITVACILVPWIRVEAVEPSGCAKGLAPMAAVLHSVVTRAEKTGENGNNEAAAAILTDYLKSRPGETHPYPYYDAGYFLHRAGKRDAAIGYLVKAVKRNPCFDEAWQLLSLLYQEAGEIQEAAAALEKSAVISQEPGLRYQTALLYLTAGCPKHALGLLKKLCQAQPKDPDWYVAMARAQQELKEAAKAAEAMASAYELSRDPEQLYQCAVFWLEAGKPIKALPLLRQLTGGASPKSHWFLALSDTLKALKKKEETAEAMEQAGRLSRDPNLLFHAAYLWVDANHPKKTLALLEELAGRHTPKVDWLLALANTYMILKQTPSAAETMDRVVRLDSKSEYLYSAGVLWLHAKRPERALKHLLLLSKRSPAKAHWFVALAHVWLAKKEMVKAATAMEQAAALSQDPKHAYQAGLMWLQAKRPDAALRLLIPLCRKARPEAQWLVALSNAWLLKEHLENAAAAMTRAAHISHKPDHAHSAAGLWLQAGKPLKALPLLEGLAKRPNPEAKWLVLLSETWFRLEDMRNAARAMERAAEISRKSEHIFRAARLWLEADRPKQALPLLKGLTQLPSPKGKWYIALSNCYLMLEEPLGAARSMEKGAAITRKGEDYYRAAMLWLQVGNNPKGIYLLRICAAKDPVKQKWLVSLAQTLVDSGRDKDALVIMERSALADPKVMPKVRYQGAVLWLYLKRPKKALPVLKVLCASNAPALNWFVSLVETHVELEQMAAAERVLKCLIDRYPEDPAAWRLAVWIGLQQADYAKAAAAMAVAVRLGPPDPLLLKELADLYHMAGVPVKAADALKKTWVESPTAADWDRLVHTYLSGHRYDMALTSAKSAVAAETTAARWKTVGAIAFRLRRFEESYTAYLRSAKLSPDADIRLMAGYAALKTDRLTEACRLFKEALRRAAKNSRTAYEAYQNLAFLKKMTAIYKKGS
ncbi:MAG: tetratricopeptide repeat protein [Deltaproteobacteria bacterium]|nr:tetratricopeptide repeat protein [Deltaproteobacteria bacterium]